MFGVGVPLVLDAAQALGHIDCAVGADVVYSSSRKWMAGPRGVGFLAVATDRGPAAATPAATAGVGPSLSAMQSFDLHEANVAARVGVFGGPG